MPIQLAIANVRSFDSSQVSELEGRYRPSWLACHLELLRTFSSTASS